MNYTAILLYKRNEFIHNDAFDFVFEIYDSQNNLITDLDSLKFSAIITDDSYTISKYDANYSAGADSQISVANGKVTVHILTDDTNNFDGDYVMELQLENKSTGFRQTVYRQNLNFIDEKLND